MLRTTHAALATALVLSLLVPSSSAGRGADESGARIASRGGTLDGSDITVVRREVRPITAAEGSNPQFKFGRLAIVRRNTYDKVNRLVPNVDYDAVGIVAFPAAGTYPYVDQWEVGKALALFWDAGDIIIPADGLYEIRTTFNIGSGLAGEKMSFAEVFGANRDKTTKFRVEG